MIRFLLFALMVLSAVGIVVSKIKPQKTRDVIAHVRKTVGIPAAKDEAPTESRTAEVLPASSFKAESLPSGTPSIRFSYEHNQSVSIVPADSNLTGITAFIGHPIRLHLENSSDYDIIRMYGADDTAFGTPNVVFDWSKRDVRSYLFEVEFFQKYKYYMIRWQSLLAGSKVKEAHFFLKTQGVSSPILQLTYHSLDTGSTLKKLSYLREETEQKQEARLPGLRLRPQSLLGLKLTTSGKTAIAECVYITPDQKRADCRSWLDADFIRSVAMDDQGWHSVVVTTDQGPFEYHFEVQSVK